MATVQEAVRRLSIQATTSGVDAATAKLDELSDAQQHVAVTSQQTEKATLSLESRFASIERRYVAQVKAQQDFERVQRQVNAAVSQNPALQERANAVLEAARQRMEKVTGVANDNAGAVGLARHELINLSRQAQDVAVSLAGGQSPLTVLMQQGSQIGDVFTSSQGTVGGFFKQITGWLGSFLTLGRVAFGGVAAAVVGASFALNDYLDAQQRVNLALTGAGRASGATNADINSIARAGSESGLSVAAARDLAAALASTGKVAKDNFLPIVQMGRDFATTFGVDATEAAQMLARAFSDPVRGAEQLNDRLGFLNEATRRQISNLVEQNRMYDAQKVLLQGVQSSLAQTAAVTSLWSRAWVEIKNTASDFFDWLGEKIANGLHLNDSLEQQAEALRKNIAGYQSGLGAIFGSSADLEMLKRQLADVNALIEKRAQATRNVASAQESLRVANTVFAQLPEIAQRQALANNAATTGATAEDPVLQRALGISQQEADRSAAINKQLRDDYKTTFQEITTSAKIASDAVTAFSPSAKALIAARQAVEQYRAQGGLDPTEKGRIAQDAYNLSLKQSAVAMSEAARARDLQARQAVVAAELDIQLVGKSIGQQAEMRANLAARQQLEQQASQNRTAFDEAEYARLQKINAEYGRRVEMAARAAANDNISFGRQTAVLSPDDVQIAQQLRGIYPDVATALGSVEAAGLRTNAALSAVSSSLSGTLVTGLADVADGTKSVSQGAADMGKAIIRAIEEMIIKLYIVIPLMRSLQAASNMFSGLGGGPLSLLGSGLSGGVSAGTLGGTGGVLGGLYHSGGVVGSHSVTRSVDPSVFHGAPRYHTGGIAGLMPDEIPAILQRGERVLPRGQSAGGNVSITINGAPGTPKVTQQDRPNGDRDIMIDFKNMVQDVMVEDAATDGRASRAMQARAVGFGGR